MERSFDKEPSVYKENNFVHSLCHHCFKLTLGLKFSAFISKLYQSLIFIKILLNTFLKKTFKNIFNMSF